MDGRAEHEVAMIGVEGPSTTAEVADAVREARARATPLRIAGRGSWLDAGRPVAATTMLPLAALGGIVDYTPGDLTLTARAGTPLDEIERVTQAEAQMLALDPHGPADGTIGATIATGSAGPLAAGYGGARDQVLGVELVTGTGEVIRGGGRVVKNVAGFDLTRLSVGAWGTLGIITEATVRLRARPEVDVTLALDVPDDGPALVRLLGGLREARIAPIAAELLDAAMARLTGAGSGTTLLVRLAGNAPAVAAQQATLATLGAARTAAHDVWPRLRRAEPDGAVVVRLSQRPSRLAETWAEAGRLAAADGMRHATIARGIVRCILPTSGAAALTAPAAGVATRIATRIAERLPAALWPAVAPTAAGDRISLGVRAAFDPGRLLNPGILGEPAS
jgi:glycolate dehydrogenase FAD-binding subunit